jgi:hypothetical protein
MQCLFLIGLLLFSQVKAVPLQLADGEPHLIFVAKRRIEISEEILFDYNDNESKAKFLKQCPVCLKLSTVSDPTSFVKTTDAVGETNAVDVTDEVNSADATDTVVSEMRVVGKKTDVTETASSSSAAATSTTSSSIKSSLSRENIEKIALKKKATKAERACLYEAFCKIYAQSSHVTRSLIEAWLPGINEQNVDYIMDRRRLAILASTKK